MEIRQPLISPSPSPTAKTVSYSDRDAVVKFYVALKLALIIIQLMEKKNEKRQTKKDGGCGKKRAASLNREKSTVIKLLSSQK